MIQDTAVAVVTGAAKRIGAEIARHLHGQGMNLVVHYHSSKAEAEQLVAELNQSRSDSAIAIPLDLANIADFNEFYRQVIAKWQRIDVLVNNASTFYKTELGKVNEQIWNDLIASNCKGPFFLAQEFANDLAKNNGCIINISDIHGMRPLQDYSVYCIAKAGLVMQTKALAKELGPDVRVNSIAPGAILWPEAENELEQAQQAKIMRKACLQRNGSPEDIAEAVWFLCNSKYITGQILSVDGGRL